MSSEDERKAIVYGRTATEAQDGRVPLAAQSEACIELAESLGYFISPEHVFTEVASGLGLDRPQLNEVRLMATTGEVDTLFVYEPVRLSRELGGLSTLLQEFAAQGVEVCFVEGGSADALRAELNYVIGRLVDLEHS